MNTAVIDIAKFCRYDCAVMIVATKPQSRQLKESHANGRSSGNILLSLKNNFLKRYVSANQDISDENLSALLLYFALCHLEQNACLSKLSHINKSDFSSLSNYLFHLLKNFLPIDISTAMPAPDLVALKKAQLFYQSSHFKRGFKEFLFQDIANLGFAYQIFSLGIRNTEALPALQSANKKISPRQLIAFTQLYTPGWVVDFLIANTILPSVLETKEILPSQYESWLMPETSHWIKNVELADQNILDPACGAGQFLFSAFDLLSFLYEQAGCKKDESVKLTLANIYGADIDKKALWVAGLGLLCKSLFATGDVPTQLCNLIWSGKNKEAGFLGSIDRSWSSQDMLGQSYRTIVTNPPYIGRKCLSRELKKSLQEQYPDSSTDLCAAFLKRCAQMLKPGGRLGVITQGSLLSIPSYQPLRKYLFDNYHFETIVRCGPGVFPLATGEKIDSVLLLAQAPEAGSKDIEHAKTHLYDLGSEKDKAGALKAIANGRSNGEESVQLSALTSGLAFGVSSQLLEKFAPFPKLGEIADIRQGLATTDNARFVRYHFDVDPQLIGSIWIPYIKGAGSKKFASENPFVVKWGNNGEEIKQAVAKAYPYLKGKTAWVVKNEEYYFRPGLCFSFINKSGLAVRRLPAGAIFDVGSSAIFAKPEDEDFLLAYLNSSFIGMLVKSINQTINVQVGDVKKIPILPFSQALINKLSTLGQDCYLSKQKLLQLQQIDLATLRKVQSTLISAEQFDLLFNERIAEQTKFSQQLATSQLEIDRLLLDGIKKFNILDNNEENELNKLLQSLSVDRIENSFVFNPTLFAHKMLVALAKSLLCDDKQIEHISIINKTNGSLSKSLSLSDNGRQWLEDKLGRSLEQIFYRAKITDISKLAGEPSRYFSLWINKQNSCVFFSTAALRHPLKPPDPIIWQPILDQLHQIKDWTSRDLYNAFSE